MSAKKILIWGGCGHGKTYLAEKISKLTNIPFYDLDNVTFNKNRSKKVSDKLRDERFLKIIKKKRWIVEGAYCGVWMHQAVKDSQLIIILKINPIVASKRVLFRYIKRKFKRQSRAGALNDLPRILKYAAFYSKDYFIKQIALIKKYHKKSIILKNRKQINNFLRKIR